MFVILLAANKHPFNVFKKVLAIFLKTNKTHSLALKTTMNQIHINNMVG
jgi:hypothetical protein